MSEKIISKGFYTHPGIPGFVSVKQYVVVKKGKENHLYFRFENPKNETLTAISFSVDCYDNEGKILKSVKLEQTTLKAKGHACFVVNRPVVLEPECIDFKVNIHSVGYGDYCYITHGNDVEVIYEKQENAHEVDRVPFLHKLGGRTHKSVLKTVHTPGFFVALVSLVMVMLFLVMGVKLHNFTRTEEFFTLEQVNYTFATDDHDGPIIIIGNKSNAKNIVVPDKIEGHDVVAVAANAFANSNVQNITFKGNIEIQDNAFINSKNLQTVTIESTKNLGTGAFYNCKNLKKVTIEKQVESIGDRAFENCSALTSISLPDGLLSMGNGVFTNCVNLAELVIPDTTTRIGQDVLLNCYSLQSLQTPFLGSSANDSGTLGYFFNFKTPTTLKEIIITKTDKVADNMFQGERYLNSIRFSLPITEIGKNAFYGCSSLTAFDIPDGVTAIGNGAFTNCSSLISVTLPDQIKKIADDLFKGCTSLQTVNFSDKVTHVGENAFSDCRSLTSLQFSDKVTYIGENALHNCTGLTKLILPFLGNSANSDPKTLTSMLANGATCKLQDFTLLSGIILPDNAFAGFQRLVNIVLPANLESVSDGCFQNCKALTSVSIPQTVSAIGENAFAECTALQTIDIPASVETTGDYAFIGCTSLTSAVFQNQSTEIGTGAFSDCRSLTYLNLPDDVTVIPEKMCTGCTALETVILPSGVTEILSHTFSNCTSLKAITLPLQLSNIHTSAFENCASLPAFTIPATVEGIGERAFAGCVSLISMVVPETLTYVAPYIFDNCTALVSITAPFPTNYSAGSVFNYYFSDSAIPESLKSVTISSNISQALPANAFKDCTGMEQLTLPSNLLSVGANAFQNCTSLTSLTIPNGVTSMGSGMLVGTNALESITLPYAGASSDYYANGFRTFYYDNSRSMYFLPDKLHTVTLTNATAIPASAFLEMHSIRNVYLPNMLTHIGANAFYNCYSLSEITLPASLTTLANSAFDACNRLFNVTNLSNIDTSGIFPNALRIFSSQAEKTQNTIQANGFTLLRTSDNTWYLTDYQHESSAISLPKNVIYQSNTVKYTLPSYLFYHDTSVTSVNISCDVTKIKSYAFYGCYNLTDITADWTNSFEELCDYAFYNCAISNATVPDSTQYIGAYAFAGTPLKAISIPASVTKIASHAFADCNALANVTLTQYSQLQTIEEYAFYNTQIRSIALPASLQMIGSYAFASCSSLLSATFSSGSQLQTIGYGAFSNSGLTSIALPASLQTIGDDAFASCSSLLSATFSSGSQLQTIGYGAFSNSGLTNITFPVSLTYISDSAFANCTSLLSVSFAYCNQLDSIGNRAFYNTNISSISLPASVIEIGEEAFRNCPFLANIAFAHNGQLSTIGDYAFYGCIISNLSLPNSLVSLGSYAFANCNNLSSVTIRSDYGMYGDAFSGSNHILEVYNLAGLSLAPGSSSYGYVAQNAMIVHTQENAESLHDVTINGLLFKKSDDTWFLMGTDGSTPTELVLSSFTYNDNTVNSFVVYTDAFRNNTSLTSLTIGNAVSEIMPYAFYRCSNLTSLTFANDCTLTKIGTRAFNECSNIRMALLPNSLLTLDDRAFYGCSALEVVLLPTNLTSIGAQAFRNCENLYDVMNMSAMSVTKGNSSYGYVAYYALAVRASNSPLSVTTIATDNSSANFVKYNNAWYLVRLDVTSNGNVIEIPKLTVDSVNYEYQIFNSALRSLQSLYSRAVLLHDSVSKIESNALNSLNNRTIYFHGTAEKWNTLTQNYPLSTVTVYTYRTCIHEDGNKLWTYDQNGNITTQAVVMDITVITEATCKNAGSEKWTCPVCHTEEIVVTPATDEHQLVNGVCTVCGKTQQQVTVFVTQANFNSCDFITNDSYYPFAIDNAGVITSQNRNNSTSSTLTITANDTMTVSFSYKVSSERNYDYLRITLNTNEQIKVSGTNNGYQAYTITLQAGDVLSFTYFKDNSAADGTDCAYIKDLSVKTMQMVDAQS